MSELQGKPTECDRHNADVTIVHVLHAADSSTPDEQLFDEFAAFFSAKFPTDTVGDVRAFVAGIYLDLKEEDQMCMEPEAPPTGDVGARSGSRGRGKGKKGKKSKGKKGRKSSGRKSSGRKSSRVKSVGRKSKGSKGTVRVSTRTSGGKGRTSVRITHS